MRTGSTEVNGVLRHLAHKLRKQPKRRIAVLLALVLGGAMCIYVMNVDGAGVMRLTNDLENDIDPAWSPTAEAS